MTAVQESPMTKPLMTAEQFEELAQAAERITDGVRLEFIDGKLGVKAVPDGDHGCIVEWLVRTFLLLRPELWLFVEQGLRIGAYRQGRARPDGVLAPSGVFAGQPEWASPELALMAVEVTSHDQDTERRDREEKPTAYAAAGIPIYLLIDRELCEVTVHAEPSKGRYEDTHTVAFGTSIEIPEPVGITLDTEPLKNWVR
jgi:Uma2 family endonuclease